MQTIYKKLDQLKQNLREEINGIPREVCGNVMQNVLKRARLCEANNTHDFR